MCVILIFTATLQDSCTWLIHCVLFSFFLKKIVICIKGHLTRFRGCFLSPTLVFMVTWSREGLESHMLRHGFCVLVRDTAPFVSTKIKHEIRLDINCSLHDKSSLGSFFFINNMQVNVASDKNIYSFILW